MKLLTALLAVLTLVLAGTTLYFAHLLDLEREHNARVATRAPLPPPTLPRQILSPEPEPEPTSSLVAPQVNQSKKPNSPPDPGEVAVKRRRLDDLHDPVARAERKKGIASMLRTDWAQIAPHIGMSSTELDRVIADMSERMLQNMEKKLQCDLDSTCDPVALRKAPGMTQEEMTTEVLGPDRYARFKAFQDSYQERNVVYVLNQQLPAAKAMNDADEELLLQALGAMRRQFVQYAEDRGEKVVSSGGIYSSAVAGAADEYARRRQTAAEYVKRELQVASGILTPQQMAVFEGELERSLYDFTDVMKNAEVAAAARASASQP